MNRFRSKVRRLFMNDRVTHAYLITGSGRLDFVDEMMAALVCEGAEKPCGHCGHCRKIALHIHPDVIRVAPEEGKREILVDQIRQLRSDAYIRPNEAQRKVYLIDPASALNASAQNALLKVLEEGPPYAVFLLTSETAAALLPTIRSRCEEIFLPSEEEEGQTVSPEGEKLAELLLKGNEYELLCHCVSLEKMSREEMDELMEQTVLALEKKIKQDVHSADRILPVIGSLRRMQDAIRSNVGVGHLAGWLCASAFE